MVRGKKFLVLLLVVGGLLVASFGGARWAEAATVVGNNVSVGNALSVAGAATVSSTLNVSGASRFYGTLAVEGALTAGSVTTTIVTTSQYISVGGPAASYNASFANGSINAAGNLSVDGTASVSSTLIIGGVATFRGNLLADVNGAPSLGSFGAAFNNVYASGTIYGGAAILGSLTSTGTVTLATTTITASTTLNGGLVIGEGGSNIAKYLTTIATVNFANLVANANADSCRAETVTLLGAREGDAVLLGPPSNVPEITWSGWVSTANTISIIACNSTDADINPDGGEWTVSVFRN